MIMNLVALMLCLLLSTNNNVSCSKTSLQPRDIVLGGCASVSYENLRTCLRQHEPAKYQRCSSCKSNDDLAKCSFQNADCSSKPPNPVLGGCASVSSENLRGCLKQNDPATYQRCSSCKSYDDLAKCSFQNASCSNP